MEKAATSVDKLANLDNKVEELALVVKDMYEIIKSNKSKTSERVWETEIVNKIFILYTSLILDFLYIFFFK
jgi:hypothetical protein